MNTPGVCQICVDLEIDPGIARVAAECVGCVEKIGRCRWVRRVRLNRTGLSGDSGLACSWCARQPVETDPLPINQPGSGHFHHPQVPDCRHGCAIGPPLQILAIALESVGYCCITWLTQFAQPCGSLPVHGAALAGDANDTYAAANSPEKPTAISFFVIVLFSQ